MQEPIGSINILPSKGNQSGKTSTATPVQIHYGRVKSFQAMAGVGSGTGTANFQFYGSAKTAPRNPSTDLSDWVPVGNSINLAPNAAITAWSTDGFSDQNAWLWFTVVVTNCTGTNLTVGAWIAG